MPHNKTARPTIRLLQEDLSEGWSQVEQRRAATRGQWDDLHPFAAVDHPIIRKSAESLGPEPADDTTSQIISSSGDLKLTEVKSSQWRAGVWADPATGVRWIVTAGLAKGGHQDHDDFYEKLKALIALGNGDSLLPTEKDILLLKRETIARELTLWGLEVQRIVTRLLDTVLIAHVQRAEIRHPLKTERLVTVELTYESIADGADGCDELVVEFLFESKNIGSEIGWEAVTRVLNALCPPVQKWDRTHEVYSVVTNAGFFSEQLERLHTAHDANHLVEGEPGTTSHYAHERHIADNSVFGKSIRALCGVFFVPAQDHQGLAVCPECSGVHQRLPER